MFSKRIMILSIIMTIPLWADVSLGVPSSKTKLGYQKGQIGTQQEKKDTSKNTKTQPQKVLGQASSSKKTSAKEITLPKTQPINSSIVIRHLRGILLLGSKQKVARYDTKQIEGVAAIGIDIPGSLRSLTKELAPFIGKALTKENLIEIKREILLYYRSHNYPVITVHVPGQDITTGVLKLVITEGVLGEVIVEGNEYFPSQLLQDYITLHPGEVIDESILLNDVQFINRNPFRRADIIYTPGKKKQTTDVKLLVQDRRPYRIYSGFENSGLVLIERNRWFAGLNWGNAWGIDHQFSYQYMTSLDFKRFQAHVGQYIIPLPWWKHMLTIFGGYSYVHVRLNQGVANSRNKGDSGQVSLRYAMPLWPGEYILHGITLGFDYKTTNNTLQYSEKSPIYGESINLTQIVLGYNLTMEYDFYKTAFDGDFFYSPGKWLSHQTTQDYQLYRAYAKSTYLYFRGKWDNLFQLPRDFSLACNVKGQVATQNLLPSEMFGVGGYNTVRGYEERMLNGDHAIVTNFEARSPTINWNQPRKKEGLQIVAFLDYGATFINKTAPGQRNFDFLISMGPGFRYTIGPYFSAFLDWGIKLHEAHRFGPSHGRVHFNVTLAY